MIRLRIRKLPILPLFSVLLELLSPMLCDAQWIFALLVVFCNYLQVTARVALNDICLPFKVLAMQANDFCNIGAYYSGFN